MENSVEVLTGTNYGIWKEDIKVLLMEKNCWHITKGDEKCPPCLEPIEKPTPEQQREFRDNLKEIKDFKIRKERAFGTIYLHLPRQYRSLITSTEDPAQAWNNLENHFRPESRARAIGLTDDFFTCRIDPDEDIGLYAARLQSIADELKQISKPIPEWYQAFQLIRFLPPDFNAVVQSIYRWKDEDFDFPKILKELLSEESRLRQCKKDQDFSVYHTRSPFTRPSKAAGNQRYHASPSDNRSVNFQSEDDSYPPKGRNSRNRNRPVPSRRSTTPNRRPPTPTRRSATPTRRPATSSRQKNRLYPETSFIVQALFSNQQTDSSTWVFDTAASSHFCCDKDLLDNYQELNGTSLNVAIAGVTCPVEGKGTVRLEFSENVWTVSNPMCEKLLKMTDEQFVDSLNTALWDDESKNTFVESAISNLRNILSNLSAEQSSVRQLPPSILSIEEKSRAAFPLGLGHATEYVSNGVALIGDSAHRVHPLAGQGVNLGFGDVKCLTECIEKAVYDGDSIGSIEYLSEYETKRQRHVVPTMFAIDALNRLYKTEFAPIVLMRSLGVTALDALHPIKSRIMQQASG